MKTKTIFLSVATLLSLLISEKATAQIGEPYIHDPSTIMECEGKYYTFGTGGGGLISEDGWTWNSGGVRPGRGAAPDAVKIGDRYLIAYSATGGGLGGSHRGTVLTMWNKTLDPNSPDFKYTEAIAVASSEDNEDCDAIDAGLLLDPTDGRLWLSYGTHFPFSYSQHLPFLSCKPSSYSAILSTSPLPTLLSTYHLPPLLLFTTSEYLSPFR